MVAGHYFTKTLIVSWFDDDPTQYSIAGCLIADWYPVPWYRQLLGDRWVHSIDADKSEVERFSSLFPEARIDERLPQHPSVTQ